MAATWVITNVQTGATNAASTSTVSNWQDFTATYIAKIECRVQNQASAASTGCVVTIDTSPDNGITVYTAAGGSIQSGSGASAFFSWVFPGLEGMYARTVFSGNLTNSVNIVADAHKMTVI